MCWNYRNINGVGDYLLPVVTELFQHDATLYKTQKRLQRQPASEPIHYSRYAILDLKTRVIFCLMCTEVTTFTSLVKCCERYRCEFSCPIPPTASSSEKFNLSDLLVHKPGVRQEENNLQVSWHHEARWQGECLNKFGLLCKYTDYRLSSTLLI